MILVFGKSGQVGAELKRCNKVFALERKDVDLENPIACSQIIYKEKPYAVINAAAYTAVDQAEIDESKATVINADAPLAMAEACAKINIPFVHISTDYVFNDKTEKSLKPQNKTNPVNIYGKTKLEGEKRIRATGVNHAIIRTSWIFSTHGSNFVKSMIHLSKNRDNLSIVSDQIGGPTPAKSVALACLSISEQLQIDPSKSGTYHLSGYPNVSWFEFAKMVFANSDTKMKITPILTKNYKTLAKRSLNSRLDCSKTFDVFGILQPDWQSELKYVLNALEIKNERS